LGGVAYDHFTRIAKIDEIMHFTSDPHLIVIPPETTDKQKEFIKIIQEAISREGYYF
jgi:hypothetical protein